MPKESYLIVLNKDEDTISFVDLCTEKVIKTIASDHNPHEVAITPDGKKTYVSCSLGNSLMVIDNETFEVIHRIHDVDFDFPHGLAIDRSGMLYLASTYSSVVYAIDTATDTIVKKTPTHEAHSHMVSLTPDEKHFYVPNIGSQSLCLFDAERFEIAETIAANSGIGYMAMQAREFLQLDIVVLAIVIYALLGKAADATARLLERTCLKWHHAFQA